MTTRGTESSTSATPILDRLTPLPPPARPTTGSGMGIALGVGLCLALAAVLAAWHPPFLQRWILESFGPTLRAHWTLARIVALGLAGLAIAVSAVMIHEVGHVLGGLAAGFRFNSLRIGPLLLERPFRVALYLGPGKFLGGWATMIAGRRDKLRGRAMALVAAGPAANLLSAFIVLLLPLEKGFSTTLFVMASIAGGLGDLLPFRTRVSASDGRRLWMLWRNSGQARRWLALMSLTAEIQAGTFPEALPAADLTGAVAVSDDTADTVMAHAFAYSAAFHQHRDLEAGERLETCLRYSGLAAPALTEALMSDAAVFQARRRRRADLAAQWLADLRQKTLSSWLCSRAEAAILEAQGDPAGALRKLDEYETAVLALPSPSQRELLLRLLPRWRSEIPASASPVAG